jgi:L-threonylcarbamoyladenylate synthase
MDAFWPGPLTVLVERSTSVHEFVTGGRATVALRCPANVFFRSIVSELDSGIVAPSANRFGHVSPTAASHVCNDLGALIDLIIDGGDSVLGLESTIIDFTTSPPQVLRHGALPVEEIAATLDTHLADPQGAQRAPGMLDSHYAPRARIRLVNDINQARELASTLHSVDQKVRILDYSNDLPMYGATLYQQLRASDDDGIEIVIAVLPEPNGLGAAIADRLHKAAVTPFEEPV